MTVKVESSTGTGKKFRLGNSHVLSMYVLSQLSDGLVSSVSLLHVMVPKLHCILQPLWSLTAGASRLTGSSHNWTVAFSTILTIEDDSFEENTSTAVAMVTWSLG